MTPTHTYTLHLLPRTPNPSLVSKFRATKLVALAAEPTGFAVKHADEIKLPLATWETRLAAPSNILVCVATPRNGDPNISDDTSVIYAADSQLDMLTSSDTPWVAMATLRGPLPYSTFHLPRSGQPVPVDPDLETYWHLCNVYTDPAHRGRGLAKRLVERSVEVAVERTRELRDGGEEELDKARVRLFFDPSKTYLDTMYRGWGFKEAGMCTLAEAFVANGDEGLVPEGTEGSEEGRRIWHRRYGGARERVVDV